MAYESGTATSHKDLLEKIKIFLTTNATLVGLGQEWVVNRFVQGHALHYLANDAFAGAEAQYAFDQDLATAWRPNSVPGYGWISVRLDADYAVSYVSITCRADGDAGPKDFNIDYSDDGNIWTTAATYTSQSWYPYEVKAYDTNVLVSETHAYWRVNVTARNSEPLVIASLELFEFGDTGYADDLAREDELIIQGPGLSGTEEIYVGIRTYSDAFADYYNFAFNAFTGYVPGNGFSTQPGRRSSDCMVPLWNTTTPYYIRANGQQVTVLAKVETVFMMMYAGKYLPYATPGQYPLPLALCGMYGLPGAHRYDNTGLGVQLKYGVPVRGIDGTWFDADVWPYFNHVGTTADNDAPYQFSTYACRDMEGTYPAIPPILHTADGVFGELDGVYFSTGFNNAVENTLTIGGDTHIIWRNMEETGFDDYYSVELT